ncbi:MAG: phosphoribosyltransferase [Acidimicrobiales bacterium]|nr:phosphoribosyltransferase [Acidimicrobiales bacterium]
MADNSPTTTEAAAPRREILDWKSYGHAVADLAQIVADDGFRADLILAIARGGLFVAGSLGYALGIKNLFVMNVEYYTGVDQRLDMPVMLSPYIDVVDLSDQRVLIADDVADTGHTLNLVRDFCLETVADVRSAVLYEKPHSLVKCEYVWKRTSDWIVFPWSDMPPIVEGQTSVVDV